MVINTGITTQNGKINIGITVPDTTIEAINDADTETKIRISTVGCPGSQEDIWNYIKPNEINMVLTDSIGNLVYNATCENE